MKVMIFAAVIEIDEDNDTEKEFSRVPNPTPFSPDELLRKLLLEMKNGRNPDLWSRQPHGPIFQI